MSSSQLPPAVSLPVCQFVRVQGSQRVATWRTESDFCFSLSLIIRSRIVISIHISVCISAHVPQVVFQFVWEFHDGQRLTKDSHVPYLVSLRLSVWLSVHLSDNLSIQVRPHFMVRPSDSPSISISASVLIIPPMIDSDLPKTQS